MKIIPLDVSEVIYTKMLLFYLCLYANRTELLNWNITTLDFDLCCIHVVKCLQLFFTMKWKGKTTVWKTKNI